MKVSFRRTNKNHQMHNMEFFNNQFISSPERQWKTNKRKKKQKGTELKITVKTVGQSKSANKDGTEGYTHTHQANTEVTLLKKEQKVMNEEDWTSWCVSVCVSVWDDPSVPQEKFTRADPTLSLSHTHSHSKTYRKASQGVFLSSVKAVILDCGHLWQRDQPSANHSCSDGPSKLLFSINSVQIIYFIYTLNRASVETT